MARGGRVSGFQKGEEEEAGLEGTEPPSQGLAWASPGWVSLGPPGLSRLAMGATPWAAVAGPGSSLGLVPQGLGGCGWM